MFICIAVGFLHLALALWVCTLGSSTIASDTRWQIFCCHLTVVQIFLQRRLTGDELVLADRLVRHVRTQFVGLYPAVTLKLKGHHALHFSAAVQRYFVCMHSLSSDVTVYMYRFGSLRNLWCMRFETVNKAVKRTVSNGNKRGISRIAMEKRSRALAAASVLSNIEEPTALRVITDEYTKKFVQDQLCDARGTHVFSSMQHMQRRPVTFL